MLPKRFEILVQRRRRDQVGGVSTGDIQSQEAQVRALMDATNAAVLGCANMSSTDVTAWQGIYTAWQQWDQKLQGCINGMPPTDAIPPDIQCMMAFGYTWDGAQSQLATYASQANGYQQRVASKCSGFQPTPTPTPGGGGGGGGGGHTCTWFETLMGQCPQNQPQPCGWLDAMLGRCQQQDTTSWASAVKWVAILGVLGLVAWYVGPMVAAVAGGAAGAIRRRSAGEFGDMRGDDAVGRLPPAPPIDRPRLDQFNFGDVSASDVFSTWEK